MFFRNLLSFLSLVLVFSTFGFSITTKAEGFIPGGDFDVMNINDCNLSVKYNKQKFEQFGLNIESRLNYILESKADSKVYVRIFCSSTGVTRKTSDLGPFWSGVRPDFTQDTSYYLPIKAIASDSETAGYVTYVKNSASANQFAVIAYSYRSTSFGNILDLNNGVFANQAKIQNSDLEFKFINEPAIAPIVGNTTISNSSDQKSIQPSVSSLTTQTPTKIEESKKIEPKFLSCEGRTGKKLNSDGDIAVKTPKGKNVIYADTKGKVFATENDYIRCVKNAKRYGVVNCTDKTDMILNSKGKKLGFYPRGTVLYASSDYGNIYVSSKTAVNCTQDQNLLQKINW